jgi:hypothetical protein
MKHKPNRFTRLTQPRSLTLLVVGLFALTGGALVMRSQASTFAVPQEIEAATLAGNAALTTNTAASADTAVRFGDLPELPREIKAITGGTNIALVWRPSRSANIQGYEVWRDNVKVATVTPGSGTVQMEIDGRRYIDNDVTRGQTYAYRLRVIGANGAVSAFSATYSAKHPTATTASPNITFNYVEAGPPAIKDQWEATIRREFAIWYPKISDALAYPGYTPATSIRVDAVPSAYLGVVGGNRMIYGPQHVTSSSLAEMGGGGMLHELTHVIADYGSKPKPNWIIEGIADWTRDVFMLERNRSIASVGMTLGNTVHSAAAGYIDYIARTRHANFARDMNTLVHRGQYTSNSVKNLTGFTEQQLLDQYMAAHLGPSGMLRGPGGKCATIPADFLSIQLAPCANLSTQRWTISYEDPARKTAAAGGLISLSSTAHNQVRCLDIIGSRISNGSVPYAWGCNFSSGQQWQAGPNDSLINPASGKCLTPNLNSTADGTQLIIMTCDGSDSQRWTLPQ